MLLIIVRVVVGLSLSRGLERRTKIEIRRVVVAVDYRKTLIYVRVAGAATSTLLSIISTLHLISTVKLTFWKGSEIHLNDSNHLWQPNNFLTCKQKFELTIKAWKFHNKIKTPCQENKIYRPQTLKTMKPCKDWKFVVKK